MATAFRDHACSWIESWEIEKGPEFDLLNQGVLGIFFQRLRRGEFWYVHLGPPCATFSRARLPALRTRTAIWGKSGLKRAQALMVKEGNLMCLVAIEVALECCRLGIKFTLENPASSMMWEFPPMLKLLATPGVDRYTLDYCMFGKDWKKPTSFAANWDFSPLERRCSGTTNCCSRTKKPHQMLRGMSPYGMLWTKYACPYPEELTQAVAQEALKTAPRELQGRILDEQSRKGLGIRMVAPPMREAWHSRERWSLVVKGQWKREEHNNVTEARGVAAVVRHLSRSSRSWGKRILIFTDSLVALGCLSKGRSSAPSLLSVCRIVAAGCLVLRLRLYLRWVPSELNYADWPSRGGPVGVEPKTAKAHTVRGVPRRLRAWFSRLLRGRAGGRHW